MKKLLIVLALIIGTSVSAQDIKSKDSKVKTPKVIKLEAVYDRGSVLIKFNTKRALSVEYKRKNSDIDWQRATYLPGEPYVIDEIYLPLLVDDTYKIRVNGKNIKKIRIVKLKDQDINPIETSARSFKIDSPLKGVGHIGRTVFITINKETIKGKVIDRTKYGLRIDFEEKMPPRAGQNIYLWFKQSI